MSDYSIRLFEDSDGGKARELFSRGIIEHAPGAFSHIAGLPRIWISVLVLSLLSFWITGSVPLSVLSAVVSLVTLWFCTRYVYTSYVEECLSGDMLDIRKYYLERDGCCFWVAESAGEVVGIVAAVPSSIPSSEKIVELRRMSIAKSHRGKGIAKALCRTVIDYARKAGADAIDLETSFAQTDAQWLYEKMGFRKTRTYYPPYIIAKFIDFHVLCYRYDFPQNR
ncbi:probable N-acetyltransferase CML1 [Spea bombifrons]|uniref:probable N-acetyltransferase CML1 n=1 Tax=Spea bombifrons TaxID=233779 RepID=UPI00234961A6|nr:probable N-acetyltransferase CML1 [Spea bombifrons]